MATQQSLAHVQELYIAYYGRPAEEAGLEYWADRADEEGIDAIINAFGTSDEYTELAEGKNSSQLVNSIYQQAFGRDAEQAGLDYYTGLLENGEASLAEIAVTISGGAQNEDAAIFDARVDAANGYTTSAGEDYDIDEGKAVIENAEVDNGGDGDNAGGSIDINFDNTASGTGGNFEIVDGKLEWVPSAEDGVEGYVASTNDTGGTTVNNIGKVEWDAAGQVATSSKDYTFNLDDQIGADEEYNGLFLSPVLSAEDRTADSQLFIDLLDLRTADTPRPLGDLPVNGFRFSVDGETVVLQSEAIFNAETYPELLTAVNETLAESTDPLLKDFEATLGGEFQATDDNGNLVSGTSLVLTDKSGGVIEEGNFTYSEDASSGGFTLYGQQSTEAPENIRELIETNLDLDNVGYGSQGASVNLVGQSNSDVGVEQINVTTQNGSWLTRLESDGAQQFLKEVNLQGSGYFKVGTQDGENVQGLEDIMLSEGGFGLIDVQDVNGGEFGGDIKLNANITGDVVERDLNATDDNVDPKDDNATFNYTTAGGDDQISLAVSSDLMAREDANLVVNAGNGDNVVETMIYSGAELDTGTPLDLTDQQLNANQTIVTGSGSDVVRTWGAGDATIGTGAGNDVIYADNSGLLNASGDSWEFNSTAAAGAVPNGQSNSDVDLSNGANAVAQTFTGLPAQASVQVKVSFKGHQSVWVDVPSTMKGQGDNQSSEITTLQVNQAIKDAVNNDGVLTNLLEATDGDGNILNIDSLIDGANSGELEIDFRDATVAENGYTKADLAGIDAIYGQTEGTPVAATGPDGEPSGAESDNTIDAGAGNDVIVLGTGANSNDTIVLSGDFGRDSVVDFTVGDDTVAGRDILDFSSYGIQNGTVETAGGYTADAGDNDQVNVIDFAAGEFAREDVNFGNLNAGDVKAAIGEQAAEGQVDSIFMVEAGDTGTYKVFDINSADKSTDFTVDLVGVVDFGESQVFDNANIA